MASICLPPEIASVFFDAVGTLIHPDPPAPTIYAEVGRRYGSRRTPAEIGPRFVQAFDRQERIDQTLGLAVSEHREVERWRAIVTDVLDDVTDPEACFQELFKHFAQPAAWRCPPEAEEVLKQMLQRGLILGLASNYDQRLRPVAAGLPELAVIRHLAISSEIGWRKPAAEFFAAVCRLAGLPAERVLFVGDDPVNDYDGAAAAGLHAVLFDPKGQAARPARIGKLTELLE